MSFETGIHVIIFLCVFVVTGFILTRKKKNTTNKKAEDLDIEEIQAEIVDAEEYRRQAQADRLKAKLELEEAEKIKRRAKNKADEILMNLKENKNESK
jgi:hypothetical protein